MIHEGVMSATEVQEETTVAVAKNAIAITDTAMRLLLNSITADLIEHANSGIVTSRVNEWRSQIDLKQLARKIAEDNNLTFIDS